MQNCLLYFISLQTTNSAMNSPLRFLLTVCLLCSTFSATAKAAVIYRETFGNTTGSNVALPAGGWTSTSNGGSGWRSSPNTGRATDLPNVSAGTTSSQSIGYLLNTTNTVSIIYTTEYVIAQTVIPDLATISWYQGNNTPSETRVIVQIGGSWYATTETFTNTAVASNANFGAEAEVQVFNWTTSASSWRALTVSGSTETLGATLTESLPTGQITAFGLYFAATSSQRFDTFEIQTIPEPHLAALGGLGTLILLIRRRRDSHLH
jgi:hypothetical protein